MLARLPLQLPLPKQSPREIVSLKCAQGAGRSVLRLCLVSFVRVWRHDHDGNTAVVASSDALSVRCVTGIGMHCLLP